LGEQGVFNAPVRKVASMATVRISGNWRNPNKMEWGGAPQINEDGTIERTINLPAGVYEAIEAAIARGDIEGAVVLPGGSRVNWLLDR
jgi:hypothetical protein